MNTKRITLFLVLAAFLAVEMFAGAQWVTTIKTSGKNKKLNNDIEAHVFAQGGNVKQVWKGVANENMFYVQDGYWLYKAKENTIYMVNPQKKSYMAMSVDAMLQLTGAMGQLVKIEILEHTINVENLPGETVAGFACSHIKVTSQYTMKIKVAIFKQTMQIKEEKEIWATKAMPGMDELHNAFKNKDFKTGIDSLDELIKKEMEQMQALGFPVKTNTLRITMDKKGKVTDETTTVMEITNVKQATFSPDTFEIPAGYAKEESPADSAGKLKLF